MVNIILVDKNGDLKISKYNKDKGDELYKKCKFKLSDNFDKRTSWATKKSNKFKFNNVTLYSRNTGKANTENKYDFPPPVDNLLFFGMCALVAEDNENKLIDLSIEEWNIFYEELFGGFENLADTAKEDENEIDELDAIPDNLKTKSGYLKDDFVVDDNQIENVSTDSNENVSTDSNETEYTDDDDDSAELELEEYIYSDEESD